MSISRLKAYGAAIFDAGFRFGFLLQVLFLFFFDASSLGLFFVLNACLITGKTISNLGFSRARYRHLISSKKKTMQQSLKVLSYRQCILLAPATVIAFALYSANPSTLILAGALGLWLGFFDFILAIHVARRDVRVVRRFALVFVATETVLFSVFFAVAADLYIAKLAAHLFAYVSAVTLAYSELFSQRISRLATRIKLSFRPLLIDVYGGLFSITLLLRAQIFPLIMYERYENDLIASFGILNQVGLIWIFILRGYMNSNQLELNAIYQGKLNGKRVIDLYVPYVYLFGVGLAVLTVSSVVISNFSDAYDTAPFLATVLLLFSFTSIYIAFNDFLIFGKQTGILLCYGIASMALFAIIYFLHNLIPFFASNLLELLAISTLPVAFLVTMNALKVFRRRPFFNLID